MKRHKLFALAIMVLLLIGNIGSVYYDGEPQTEPTQVVYLPIVYHNYTPPPSYFSTSYYVQLDARENRSTHIEKLKILGCDIGKLEQSIPGPQDHIVILALGKPWTTGVDYQVKFYRPSGVVPFVTINLSEVDDLIREVVKGYWACKDFDSNLTLAIGVNTFDTYGILIENPYEYVDESYGHGLFFARMVKDLSTWVNSQGYQNRITVAGALDSEVYFNPPMIAKEWVRGYTNANSGTRFYNYGACEGCPESPTTSWRGGNGWTQEDIWYVSWGAPPAWPIPEIYAVDSVHAIQWQNISWYAWKVHGQKIDFAGALTQFQACQQRGGDCDGGLDNYPLDGWQQLYNELNKNPVTAQSFLRWSSDIRWLIK